MKASMYCTKLVSFSCFFYHAVELIVSEPESSTVDEKGEAQIQTGRMIPLPKVLFFLYFCGIISICSLYVPLQ